MYTVYVLHSERYNKVYIGMTSNLEQRLQSHNVLSNKGWTRKFRPWKPVYKEEYEMKSKAMRREKELKSSRGRKIIKELLSHQEFISVI